MPRDDGITNGVGRVSCIIHFSDNTHGAFVAGRAYPAGVSSLV